MRILRVSPYRPVWRDTIDAFLAAAASCLARVPESPCAWRQDASDLLAPVDGWFTK